ncbi:arginine repressor [Bifidobacterium sp. ESL0728]|uniref:arginine repressor n=1 Tax=Bifidobacterium sp. ESL0728 TaxID=2983220 RepID=UPI0023F66E73|nr:arginine repressor [Bifidobacterium sp. ESL0728]WEV58303.1 arginine repressor [Bifidobacterium sp. ESL0728]
MNDTEESDITADINYDSSDVAGTVPNGGEQGSETKLQHPTNRTARLSVIQEILSNSVVSSQGQLLELLADRGIEVTQATLSRDLDEMKAVKTRLKTGEMAYTLGVEPEFDDATAEKIDQQLSRGLSGLITSAAAARNLVIVHTPSGAAQYMASVIDKQPIEGILGTVAGDDTVLLVCDDDDAAVTRMQWLLDIVSRGQHQGA